VDVAHHWEHGFQFWTVGHHSRALKETRPIAIQKLFFLTKQIELCNFLLSKPEEANFAQASTIPTLSAPGL